MNAPEGADLPNDVIPIRPGEEIDSARLANALAGRVPGSDLPLRIEQFGGGHANLTYLLRFGAGAGEIQYVLRRPPLGPVAPGSHDMVREYRALSVLWMGFPLAPRAHYLCEDPLVIGAPFFVMERREGVVVRGGIPPRFGGGQDRVANRKLSEVVVDVLADFHAVDPRPLGLDAMGRPEGFLERQVKGWAGRFERAKTGDDPIADEVARWLERELPASPSPTPLHNDWRLDNMAVSPDDPGRCVAVFDWDMFTIGDPLADLGTVLAVWADPGEAATGPTPMPTQCPGFLSRAAAAERYGERSGRDLSTLPFYLVFGTFKMAVVLQQIYFRFARGQTQDGRFASLGDAAQKLFAIAASRRP